MINIKEALKTLLIEAAVSDEEHERLRLVRKAREEAEEQLKHPKKRKSSSNSEATFWSRPAFYLLCEEAIINTGCLDKISLCLHANFNPDTNQVFLEGINEFIFFYIDIINSYNEKDLIGAVKEAVNSLEKDILSERALAESTINEIKNFFYNTDEGKPKPDRQPFQERDYDLLVDQLKNLSIASNIINWKRLAVYSKSKGNVEAVKDIFKSGQEDNSKIPTNLPEALIQKFYNSKNEFSNFLSSLSWGNLSEGIVPDSWNTEEQLKKIARINQKKEEDTAKRAKARKKSEEDNPENIIVKSTNIMGTGDSGALSGDNEYFIYNVLIRYLVSIITTDKLNVASLFKEASEKAVDAVLKSSLSAGSHVPFETGGGEEEPTTKLDMQDPNIKAEDFIPAIIDFQNTIKNLKDQNRWETKDTLAFLSTALSTKSGADGLSSIINETFKLTGDKILGTSFISPIIKDNTYNTFNVLQYMKDKALKDNNFLVFLSNLVAAFSEINLNETVDIKREVLSLFIEAKRAGGYGVLPVDIEELIEELPKTREEAIKTYTVSHNQMGYSLLDISNKAASKINSAYKKLQTIMPILKVLSPSETEVIPEALLHSDSALQKALGINIVPETSIGSSLSNLTPSEIQDGHKAVRLNTGDYDSLSKLFDVYLKTITDILHPRINLPAWGLYKIIPATTRKPYFRIAKKIAAFPSLYVPVGSKVSEEEGGQQVMNKYDSFFLRLCLILVMPNY